MLARVFSLVFHAVTDGYFYAGVVVGAAIGGATLVGWFRSVERQVLRH